MCEVKILGGLSVQDLQPTSRFAWAGAWQDLGGIWKGRHKLYIQALVSYHMHCASGNEASQQTEWATEHSHNPFKSKETI